MTVSFSLSLASAGVAFAQEYLAPVSIRAGPLNDGLHTLQRETGIELLFDPVVVSGLHSPAVNGRITTEAALKELLATTDLTTRRAQSGAWIVERSNTPPLARRDAAVPEIV